MTYAFSLHAQDVLPQEGYAGTMVGRVWRADVGGPSVVALRHDGVYDLSEHAPTMSSPLELADPAKTVEAMRGQRLGSLDELLPHLLTPCDLQVVKASGVTFAASLLARVIEERAGGDQSKAQNIRKSVEKAIGGDLRAIRPGRRGVHQSAHPL